MKVAFVDLKAQYDLVKPEIDLAISSVIADSGFIGGKYVSKFEKSFAQYCQAKYCVGVGNGTDAIYIALRALGVGHGDEVITVANSFIATSEAITMTGARVVFVDCVPDTYNIDVNKVEGAITSKTKAIIPVHLYGRPADMPCIMDVANKHNLFVVEDAAQAHGSLINERNVGVWGHIGCFSFYPGKNLGAYGDAGAIVTNNEDLAIKIRMIANHGRVEKYNHEFEGVNSRLDGMQAAILDVKLKHLDNWIENRRKIASLYAESLKGCDVILPNEGENISHVFHLYVVRVKNRDKVRETLNKNGISTGIHYPIVLPSLKAYKYLGYTADDFSVATKYSKEILSLPIYPELEEEKVEYVCVQLIKALI